MIRKFSRSKLAILCIYLSVAAVADDVNIQINSYFDNALVFINFPSLNISKDLGKSTRVSGGLSVDAISAASMRSHFPVDGVASATKSRHGQKDIGLDELRVEGKGNVTYNFSNSTISATGIYSSENDYQSTTLSTSLSKSFAQDNTTVILDYTHRFDTVSPDNRHWQKDKHVSSTDFSITQSLTPKTQFQVSGTYQYLSGFLSNPYQVVTALSEGDRYLPVNHPATRHRFAMGFKGLSLLTPRSALQAGYRFYRDSWEITGHTLSMAYKRYIKPEVIRFEYGWRLHMQSRADFFKARYASRQKYMAVDARLNALYSNELSWNAILSSPGKKLGGGNPWNFGFKIYQRQLASPDWHSRNKNLWALMFNVGHTISF